MKRFDNVIGKRRELWVQGLGLWGFRLSWSSSSSSGINCEEMERTTRVFRFSFTRNKFSGLKFGALDSD
ncbi:hypothetical protein SLA2020_056690 [Shorea laevis]